MKTKTLGHLSFVTGFVLTVMLAFACTDANATKPKPKPNPGQEQEQGQQQGQQQEQSQNQSQTAHGGFGEGGDAYSDIRVTTEVEGDSYDIPVNSAFAPQAYTLQKCGSVLGVGSTRDDGSVAVGIQTPWWASRQLRDCWRRADAEWAKSIGAVEDSIDMRCRTKSMQIHYGSTEDCQTIIKKSINVVGMLNNRIKVLEKQKETLLIERKYDQERCAEETRRAHETCVTK